MFFKYKTKMFLLMQMGSSTTGKRPKSIWNFRTCYVPIDFLIHDDIRNMCTDSRVAKHSLCLLLLFFVL